MYEMSTGLELHKEVPVVSDYDLISRGNRERLQEIMTFVFNTSDDVSSGSVSHKDAVKMVRRLQEVELWVLASTCGNSTACVCYLNWKPVDPPPPPPPTDS